MRINPEGRKARNKQTQKLSFSSPRASLTIRKDKSAAFPREKKNRNESEGTQGKHAFLYNVVYRIRTEKEIFVSVNMSILLALPPSPFLLFSSLLFFVLLVLAGRIYPAGVQQADQLGVLQATFNIPKNAF